jgi:hypothetical protein
MPCQELALMRARCRIEVEERDGGPGPRYAAHMYVVSEDGRVLRPLTFDSGQRAEIRASTAPLAFMSAIGYLESRFGAQTEYAHACVGDFEPSEIGEPFVLDQG